MIDKDKAIIYIHSTKHPLYNWSQEELDQKVEEFIQAQDSYDFKLVVVYVVYNEEDFLEDSLNSCLNFNDLDGIFLLDGAWNESIISDRKWRGVSCSLLLSLFVYCYSRRRYLEC